MKNTHAFQREEFQSGGVKSILSLEISSFCKLLTYSLEYFLVLRKTVAVPAFRSRF